MLIAESLLISSHPAKKLAQHASAEAEPEPEAQEFIMARYPTWEEARDKAYAEARAEARLETYAKSMLIVLEVRRIAVPAAVRRRILAEKDFKRLERWYKKAIVAKSLQEVFGRQRRVASMTRRQHAQERESQAEGPRKARMGQRRAKRIVPGSA